MATTGSFGSYIFEINTDRKVTYSDLNIDSEPAWAEHEMLNVKPRSEFLHGGKKTASLNILLSLSLGIVPEKELDGLRKMADSGEYATLMIGSRNKGKFYISSIGEEYKNFDNLGHPVLIKAKLNLKEFCDETYKSKTSTSSATKTTTTTATTTTSSKKSTKKTTKKTVKGTKKVNYSTGKVVDK